MARIEQLSKADSKVLAQVFDPESAPERTEIFIDPSLPADQHIRDPSLLAALRKRETAAIRLIEAYEKTTAQSATAADHSAKEPTFRTALALLDALVAEHPQYASARNNRAQLRRWRFGDRHLLCQARPTRSDERFAAATAAVADLQTGMALAAPPRPSDAIAPAQARVLAQAHTQLGALLHAAAKDLADVRATGDQAVVAEPFADWAEMAPARFEEEASRLFYAGGRYGNEVAKALAVHANPHAKLCGSIVQEAMRKEMMAGDA